MSVRYRSATLGEFIEEQSHDVSRGGMFIKTAEPFPAGTLLKFELQVADDERLMTGVGRVVWKREQAASEEDPAGMGIKFIKIDDASRALFEKLAEPSEERAQSSKEGQYPSSSTPVFEASGAVEAGASPEPHALESGVKHSSPSALLAGFPPEGALDSSPSDAASQVNASLDTASQLNASLDTASQVNAPLVSGVHAKSLSGEVLEPPSRPDFRGEGLSDEKSDARASLDAVAKDPLTQAGLHSLPAAPTRSTSAKGFGLGLGLAAVLFGGAWYLQQGRPTKPVRAAAPLSAEQATVGTSSSPGLKGASEPGTGSKAETGESSSGDLQTQPGLQAPQAQQGVQVPQGAGLIQGAGVMQGAGSGPSISGTPGQPTSGGTQATAGAVKPKEALANSEVGAGSDKSAGNGGASVPSAESGASSKSAATASTQAGAEVSKPTTSTSESAPSTSANKAQESAAKDQAAP